MMIYLGSKVDVEEEGMPWEGQVDKIIFSNLFARDIEHQVIIITKWVFMKDQKSGGLEHKTRQHWGLTWWQYLSGDLLTFRQWNRKNYEDRVFSFCWTGEEISALLFDTKSLSQKNCIKRLLNQKTLCQKSLYQKTLCENRRGGFGWQWRHSLYLSSAHLGYHTSRPFISGTS